MGEVPLYPNPETLWVGERRQRDTTVPTQIDVNLDSKMDTFILGNNSSFDTTDTPDPLPSEEGTR